MERRKPSSSGRAGASRSLQEGALRVIDNMDCHAAILQLQPPFTEKPSIKAHSIPDSVHGISQRVDGPVSEAMSLTAKALQQFRRLIEVSSVCCVRIPKMFAAWGLYIGVEGALPSSSVKIERAYIPINHLEGAGEDSGCIMWNPAAKQYPESLIGANLGLEVLLVDLGILSLGILGNLACPEALIMQISFTRGLMKTIIDQVLLNATTCWGEPCRFPTLGLQGSGRAAWASVLQPEHSFNRDLGIAAPALYPQLVTNGVSSLQPSFITMWQIGWAVENVNTIIGPALVGKDPTRQVGIDNLLVQQLDGTINAGGWCKQKLEPVHALKIRSFKSGGTRLYAIVQFTTAEDAERIFSLASIRLWDGSNYLKARKLDADIVPQPGCLDDAPVHRCHSAGRGDKSVLLRKALEPPDPKIIDDALNLLVPMKALQKMQPRLRHDPTFYGRLRASFSLSFDTSVLILKCGSVGILREGILFGKRRDTQPLPILRPFGQDKLFTEYTDSYYTADGDNAFLTGKKEPSLHQISEIYDDNLSSLHQYRPKFLATSAGLPLYYDPYEFRHTCLLQCLPSEEALDVAEADKHDEIRKCLGMPFVSSGDFQTRRVAEKFVDVVKEIRVEHMQESINSRNGYVYEEGSGVNEEALLCKFFLKSLCTRSTNCLFSHSLQAKRPACKFFTSLQGLFSHDVSPSGLLSSGSGLCTVEDDNVDASALVKFFNGPVDDRSILILDDTDLLFSANFSQYCDPSKIICTTSLPETSVFDPSLSGVKIIWGLQYPCQSYIFKGDGDPLPWNEVKCVLWFPSFGSYGDDLEGQQRLLQIFFEYLAIRILADTLCEPEQTLAKLPSREFLWWKPVKISNASGMVDGEEVKVDTGQCPLSEWPPPFSSRNCKEGDSVLLATTNSATPILRTMGVCANRKHGLCVFTVKPALLPCWFSIPKLASGVDNVQFGYARKDELTVVVTSSQNGEKEARARREGLEHREKHRRSFEAMSLTAKALQPFRRLIEVSSVCCVRIPKMFAAWGLYIGVEGALPSSSIKIERAYIPINHLEGAGEDSGCIMWNPAAKQYPESLIGANLGLEVLLGEPCRFPTLGLQGSGRAAWASVLQPEHSFNRDLGIAAPALYPQLVTNGVSSLQPSFITMWQIGWAVENVNTIIGPALVGKDPTKQVGIDNLMVQQLDGTINAGGWCKQKLEPVHALKIRSFKSGGTRLYAIVQFTTAEDAERIFSLASIRLWDGSNYLKARKLDADIVPQPGCLDDAPVHRCHSAGRGDKSVLLRKALEPPDPEIIDDALNLLVQMKALQKMQPRLQYDPTFYGRLLANFSLSFDTSVLILKCGSVGILREGILLGIRRDTQPLPILRPFGQDKLFTEYTDSYYAADGDNAFLTGKKEVACMANLCAYQFWQRLFKDKLRLEHLKCLLDVNGVKASQTPSEEALDVAEADKHDEIRKCLGMPFVSSGDFQTRRVAEKFVDVVKEIRVEHMQESINSRNGYVYEEGSGGLFSHDVSPSGLLSSGSGLCTAEDDNVDASALVKFFNGTVDDRSILILDDTDLLFSANFSQYCDPSKIICTTSLPETSVFDPSLSGVKIIWGLQYPCQSYIFKGDGDPLPWNEVKCVLWFPSFGSYGDDLEGQKRLLQIFFEYLAIRILADTLCEVHVVVTMNNIRFVLLQVEKLGRDSFFFLKDSFPMIWMHCRQQQCYTKKKNAAEFEHCQHLAG
ncbi:hypothetical protein Nepgr_023722 [Nepenthes gracilis]|uniref:C3H1-type domain-containing protein n=1 Tax=Nepenthes gracilis TaxID=150966 RepID=A0AAD3T3A5_NEPGR|nr:hypothetical protein Nepgr_023722 [Nepenthes gracilis]